MKYEIEFRVNFRKAQGLANSPKAQQMDSARSHNAEENHKGHKFCVGRVRFGSVNRETAMLSIRCQSQFKKDTLAIVKFASVRFKANSNE